MATTNQHSHRREKRPDMDNTGHVLPLECNSISNRSIDEREHFLKICFATIAINYGGVRTECHCVLGDLCWTIVLLKHQNLVQQTSEKLQ